MAASLTSSRIVVLVEVVGAVALDTSSKACADLQYAAADSALYTQHSCQASVAEFSPCASAPCTSAAPPHLCSEPECYGNLIQMKTDTVHSPQHCMTCEQVGSSTYLVTYHTLQLLSSIAIPWSAKVLLLPPQALSKRCCTVQDAAEPGFLAEPSGGAQREARISAADPGMKPAIEEIDCLEAGARA